MLGQTGLHLSTALPVTEYQMQRIFETCDGVLDYLVVTSIPVYKGFLIQITGSESVKCQGSHARAFPNMVYAQLSTCVFAVPGLFEGPVLLIDTHGNFFFYRSTEDHIYHADIVAKDDCIDSHIRTCRMIYSPEAFEKHREFYTALGIQRGAYLSYY